MVGALLLKPIREIADGVTSRTLPWLPCLAGSVFFQVLCLSGLDYRVVSAGSLSWLYPSQPTTYWIYYSALVSTPFWVWAWIRVGVKQRLTRRLTEVFRSVGLQNNLGRLPHLVFDRPLDEFTRKLRLTRAILPLQAFEKAKGALEGGLQIYVDEIRENREAGTVDIIYAHAPMPGIFKFPKVTDLTRNSFFVGTTRSRVLTASLREVPHLLVAGQTGGGKSTFLRQWITSVYVKNPEVEFTLIDLKGGMEFQVFENLPRVTAPDSVGSAVSVIQKLHMAIEARMKLLKTNKCKDIDEYLRLPKSERVSTGGVASANLSRHVIVVDEAAEMFLAGHHASGQEIQTARRVLSQVARQGRSIGIHLVIATQRPDSRALDPQIKANLTGVICFQMVNDISSITVLGTGRATDLPPIPGRAIWKCGAEMTEVQTPFMEIQEAEALLKPHYREGSPTPRDTDESAGLDRRKKH